VRVRPQRLLFSSDPTTVIKEDFMNPETGQNEEWCRSWLEAFLRVQSLTFGTAVIVVVVNLLFRRLLKPVVRFEHAWWVRGGAISPPSIPTSTALFWACAHAVAAKVAVAVWGTTLLAPHRLATTGAPARPRVRVQSDCASRPHQRVLPLPPPSPPPPATPSRLRLPRSRTAEVLSRATKLFFLQFLNTAVLVLVLNAQIDVHWTFLKKGEFRDFTVAWYLSVGTSITLTMIAYVFTPHISPLLQLAFKRIRQFCDRGCSKDRWVGCALRGATRTRGWARVAQAAWAGTRPMRGCSKSGDLVCVCVLRGGSEPLWGLREQQDALAGRHPQSCVCEWVHFTSG
jgi:hypothetical protein